MYYSVRITKIRKIDFLLFLYIPSFFTFGWTWLREKYCFPLNFSLHGIDTSRYGWKFFFIYFSSFLKCKFKVIRTLFNFIYEIMFILFAVTNKKYTLRSPKTKYHKLRRRRDIPWGCLLYQFIHSSFLSKPATQFIHNPTQNTLNILVLTIFFLYMDPKKVNTE